MARAARDTGNGAVLFPSGVTSIEDISWDLNSAIEHANAIISWQRNLEQKEVPPKWMWAFPDELTVWFEEVEVLREQKYSSSGSDDSDEDFTMQTNQLAKEGVRTAL